MVAVIALEQTETVHLDTDTLSQLHTELGDRSAEDVLCRATEELGLRLQQLDHHWRDGDWPEIRKSARLIAAIAEQAGMTKTTRVAQDVILTVDAQNLPALGATVHRLLRIGAQSLIALWDTGGARL